MPTIDPKPRRWNISVWYFLAAAVLLAWLQAAISSSREATLSYDEFKTLLRAGKLTELQIGEKSVTGQLQSGGLAPLLSEKRRKDLEALPPGVHRFAALRVEDPSLIHDLEAARVRYSGRIDSDLAKNLLSWLIPGVVLFGLWALLLRRLGNPTQGMLEIGKSKAKVFMETDVKVRFEDVAGVDEAKDELKEIVDFLRDPARHGRLGARVPKGVLLVGPPGTGKTLLARAVAGEAGVPFFSINGPEFVEMFVGVGAARVRDLFEKARGQAPAIIFIDELDALGRARGSVSFSSGHDEKEQTLNQLLSELDGFDPRNGLVLLAATNRPEILDPALLRAGRFDRQVLVDRPDRPGRKAILALYLRRIKAAAGLAADEIAALTPGFSGADLANLVNEAALAATRRGAAAVELVDFHVAIERIVAGLEKKSRILRPAERRVVATHELGHAIVAMAVPGSDPVQKISIIPRGIAGLGYTRQTPGEDRFLVSRQELQGKMAVLLGGRAAERLVFDDVSSGAADDLEKATAIARSMVTRLGMDETIGHVSYAEGGGLLGLPADPRAAAHSPRTADAIDQAVHDLLESAYQKALAIVKIHHVTLERWAQKLLERETLDGDELAALRAALVSKSEDAAPALGVPHLLPS